jgi:two-component system chemotaxis response regulator CheB
MISSFTGQGSAVALEALANGAAECLPKPTATDLSQPERYAQVLVKTIKDVSRTNVRVLSFADEAKKIENYTLLPLLVDSPLLRKEIIAMGASMGGVDALEQVLGQLPQVLPPVLVIQHLKKSEFSSSFVKRINQVCNLSVVEAMHGQQLFPGHVYVAPHGRQLSIKSKNSDYYCSLEDGDDTQERQPSIDVLFSTVAKEAKGNSIGILLTGEGEDGVIGLKQIKQAGGVTLAQDKETSVMWEMPGAAVRANAVNYVLPLDSIPSKILEILDEKGRPTIST